MEDGDIVRRGRNRGAAFLRTVATPRKALACAAAAVALGAAVFAGVSGPAGTASGTARAATGAASAAQERPCDIYAAGRTPCVAAYSTTRALYRDYDGPLYQLTRQSDGAQANIGVSGAGGYADAARQDRFCAHTVCTISRLYDQSPERNDLGIEPIGGNGSADAGAIANALPVTVDGHHVYGLNVQAGVGYRNDVTDGVPTGAQPQGAYMVTSGTHTDDLCCFDFGNAETSNTDTGNGHMDAVYFGSAPYWGTGSGSGPWVMADLENGLFAGGNGSDPTNTGDASPFVTAMVKNNGTTTYAIKDGDARSGPLRTDYEGPLPDTGGYVPMHQEGSVLLGTGGDDSNGSDGSFFEGVVTDGYPSDATDAAVQANVTAAHYQQAPQSFPVGGTAYTIVNTNSGKAVQPDNCATADGTGMELYTPQGSACQQWTFARAGSGHYTITNSASGKVLESASCGSVDGTVTDLAAPSPGSVCQEWNVTPDGPDVTISNVGNGMVLDAEDCQTANGTVVRQWAQLDNTCQQYAITSGT